MNIPEEAFDILVFITVVGAAMAFVGYYTKKAGISEAAEIKELGNSFNTLKSAFVSVFLKY